MKLKKIFDIYFGKRNFAVISIDLDKLPRSKWETYEYCSGYMDAAVAMKIPATIRYLHD